MKRWLALVLVAACGADSSEAVTAEDIASLYDEIDVLRAEMVAATAKIEALEAASVVDDAGDVVPAGQVVHVIDCATLGEGEYEWPVPWPELPAMPAYEYMEEYTLESGANAGARRYRGPTRVSFNWVGCGADDDTTWHLLAR